jgi:hypothetical protein
MTVHMRLTRSVCSLPLEVDIFAGKKMENSNRSKMLFADIMQVEIHRAG